MKSIISHEHLLRRVVADFMLGDRRIAEQCDPKSLIDPLEDFGFGIPLGRSFSEREVNLLYLLQEMRRYALNESGHKGLELYREVTWRLGRIRQYLQLSVHDIAEYVDVDGTEVEMWESGVRIAGWPVLYSWCQGLGLVCPPKTALVRAVDFSPQLLRFLQEDPTRLRSLTPEQFERFTAERLDRMGYNVKLTGPTNRKDGGIDLIAVPKLVSLGSYVIAGQVKHHRGDQTTGVDAVDRLLAWKDSVFRAGLLVTNTSFTNDAVWKAHNDGNAHFLRLRDFTDLKRWLQNQYGSEEDWREIPDRIELAPGVVIEIPRPRITSVFQDQSVRPSTPPAASISPTEP